MSALGILALLRAAHEALPDGTAQERTLWIQQRRRELEAQLSLRGQPVNRRQPQPFSQIANHPAVVRSGGDK